MKTAVLTINFKYPEKSLIARAAQILKKSGLVAFPTETVYGLGANALDAEAVKKIFAAKGRPADNPLIVHISDKNDVTWLAKDAPEIAYKLIDFFWPGPLTLILKKSPLVPSLTTGGLGSIALRMPKNKIALALIKEANTPIAAPSANLSGKPSPTSAMHVMQDLQGKINLILDGGKTPLGIESTVLDLTAQQPILLRPGVITLDDLEKVLGRGVVRTFQHLRRKKTPSKSPGMKYRHYAPNAQVILVEGHYLKMRKKIQEFADRYKKYGKIVSIITSDKHHQYHANIVVYRGKKLATIASNLFRIFRHLDVKKVDVIIIEGIRDTALGVAIMNRMRKAAQTIYKV